jgi:hypothetical protein
MKRPRGTVENGTAGASHFGETLTAAKKRSPHGAHVAHASPGLSACDAGPEGARGARKYLYAAGGFSCFSGCGLFMF